MPPTALARLALLFGAAALVFTSAPLPAQDPADWREELRQLRQQNEALEQQLQKQQGMIEALSKKVGALQQSQAQPGAAPASAAAEMDEGVPTTTGQGGALGRVNISGEGGVAFLHTGSEGMFPNGEFRLDEARLFVETPVLDDVYFFGELDLATREEPDVELRVGELYLDFENVSQLWNKDRQLNVRLGRMFVPFGEEYLTRYAIDNPFISHSLSDLWGVDEGLELYGVLGKFSYVAAVQNGGIPDTRDFTPDKSVAGRVSYDPTPQWHLSLSGMRTGDLDVHQDQLSAMWFGGGFFRSLGSPATTSFGVDLAEADIQFRLPHGHVSAFGGYIHYGDNDPAAANGRDGYYYSVEAVHDIVGKLYGGARFSQVLAGRGFPVVGNGDFGDYLFGPLTTELWRLSLDLGYRWSQNLLLKAEYSFERGRTADGETRNREDLFALEAAYRF